MESEEECMTPKNHQIPAPLVCPPPPKKKQRRVNNYPWSSTQPDTSNHNLGPELEAFIVAARQWLRTSRRAS